MGLLPFEQIKREVLVKKESETSAKYGCYPEERPTEELLDYGIINIDKPSGPTSHQVSAYVQDILKVKKSGHAGTLDPKVTGVLPIAIGRATRIVQALLDAGKEYVTVMHLHKEVDEETLRKTINEFIGKIRQLPPVKSAVKREWRYRNVYYFDILEIVGKDVLFVTGVEAGTYIRKICSDLGDKLKVRGNMADLRRTKAAGFTEESLVTLHDLKDAYWHYKEQGKEKYLRYCIQPIENAVKHLPKIYVFDSAIDTLCHGADLKVPGISKIDSLIEPGDRVAVMSLKNELICLGKAGMNSDEMIKKEKGLAAKTEKVFMLPGSYPRMKKKD